MLIDDGANGVPALGELLRRWSLPLAPMITLSIALALYVRGWNVARVTRERELPIWRAASFLAGVVLLWMALASPIDALDDYLLAAHMIQHFILMSVAPPLIVLGAPVVPMLRGMPRVLIHGLLRPLFRSGWIRGVGRVVTHPVFAWIAMNVAYLGWHVPTAFELTFRSEGIHDCEHVCFFATSLAFWWVVLRPWPAPVRWPRWAMIPYLLSADVVNTVLSATLAFSGRVLYPSYVAAPRICFLTPLKDQVAAGAEMWVLNSLVMLVPAVAIAVRELSPRFLVKPVTSGGIARQVQQG
ncbi:MAG TPA: cytochrome c oxidase assembly protein [Terracidiphilus sp.]|nr:cytochrome c oxidase assembly protein [Terracidiphilus sp.]